MVTIETVFDRNVNKEFGKRVRSLFCIYLIIGIIGLISSLAILFNQKESSSITVAIGFFSFVVIFSLLMIILLFRASHKTNLVDKEIFTYNEEKPDEISIQSFRDGNEVGVMQIKLSDIKAYKVTKSYYFMYFNKVNAFPICKIGNEKFLEELVKKTNAKKKRL